MALRARGLTWCLHITHRAGDLLEPPPYRQDYLHTSLSNFTSCLSKMHCQATKCVHWQARGFRLDLESALAAVASTPPERRQ